MHIADALAVFANLMVCKAQKKAILAVLAQAPPVLRIPPRVNGVQGTEEGCQGSAGMRLASSLVALQDVMVCRARKRAVEALLARSAAQEASDQATLEAARGIENARRAAAVQRKQPPTGEGQGISGTAGDTLHVGQEVAALHEGGGPGVVRGSEMCAAGLSCSLFPFTRCYAWTCPRLQWRMEASPSYTGVCAFSHFQSTILADVGRTNIRGLARYGVCHASHGDAEGYRMHATQALVLTPRAKLFGPIKQRR